jgi:E3 ubiquitin-protein ligase UBR4
MEMCQWPNLFFGLFRTFATMDRFLSLGRDPSSPVPPIGEIISEITEDLDFAFFKTANRLRSVQKINYRFWLTAVREIIARSPLNNDKPPTDDELKASASYKWLFLLSTIATREIPEDPELETARNEYIFQKIHEFLMKIDLQSPTAVQFGVGLLGFAARLLDSFSHISPTLINPELFVKFSELLTLKDFPNVNVPIQEFPVPDIFYFLCPISKEYISSANVFQDVRSLFRMGILRFLYRVVRFVQPEDVEGYRHLIQRFCIEGLTRELGRKVLTALFEGNEDAAFEFSDTIEYTEHTRALRELCDRSEGFKVNCGYESSTKLSKILNDIIPIAKQHPRHWITFLESHRDVVEVFVSLLGSEYDVNFIISSATLLRIGSATFEELGGAVNLFISSNSSILRKELMELLLVQPDRVQPYIVKSFRAVCCRGSRSQDFFHFLEKFIDQVSDAEDILVELMKSLKDEFREIQVHPNSHVYQRLANFIEVTGSYLDEHPCGVCNNPERPPTRLKANEIVSGQKFAFDTIFTQLKNPLLISSFLFSFSIKKRSKIPRIIRISVSPDDIVNVNDLVQDTREWLIVDDLEFTREKTSIITTLPLPLLAACLKFQVIEFWPDVSEGGNTKCPQCHQGTLDPRSGICPVCTTNSRQCRTCRRINYDDHENFICLQCGSCEYVNFEWSITGVQSFTHTRVNSSEDVTSALTKCDELLANAQTISRSLGQLRGEIDETLSQATQIAIQDRINKLNSLYNDRGKAHSYQLTSIVQHVSAIRSAVVSYLNLAGNRSSVPKNMCYNCRASYINLGLLFLAKTRFSAIIERAGGSSLLFSFLDFPAFTASAAGSLLQFCRDLPDLRYKILQFFKDSLPNPSPHVVRLLCEIGTIQDANMSEGFSAIKEAVIASTDFMNTSSAIVPTVIHPLIQTVLVSPVLMKNSDFYVKGRIFSSWCHQRGRVRVDPLEVFPSEIVRQLLIDCPSRLVRSLIADFLTQTSTLSARHLLSVYELVSSWFCDIDNVTMKHEQCIDVFEKLHRNSQLQRKSIGKGMIERVVDILSVEVESVVSLESSLILDLSVGSSVELMTRVLKIFVSGSINTRFVLSRKSELVTKIIHLFFRIRSLIIQRSKYLDDSLSVLKDIVSGFLVDEFVIDSDDMFKSANGTGPSIFITSAMDSLKYGHFSVIQELASLMFPARELLNFPIIVQTLRSQQDFFPDRISAEPTMSRTFGPLMRDIKIRTCTNLGMSHLIHDDHGVELLVLGNLIGLDLPVDEVYVNVWVPSKGTTPMTVIFRLQGLDGEATERMITSFRSEQVDEVSAEVKFAYTEVLCDSGGFLPLLSYLKKDTSIAFVSEAIRCLNGFSACEKNRRKLCSLGGICVGFDVLSSVVGKAKPTLFESILMFLGSLIHEDPNTDTTPDIHIEFLFNLIVNPIVRHHESLLVPILSLVPPLASSSSTLMAKVLHLFLNGLRPSGAKSDSNLFAVHTSLHLLNGFGEFALALPLNEAGNAIRDLILQGPFMGDAISYICSLFPMTSDSLSANVDSIQVAAALKTIAGMVSGHSTSQQLLLSDDLVSRLLELETVVSSNSIGELASIVIERAICPPSVVSESINAQLEYRNESAKQRANAERQKVLEDAAASVSPELAAMIEDIADEDSWSCCICKEGYAYYPDQLLGFYVFVDTKERLSTTHFVGIHPICHHRNKPIRRDQSEWDAAAVRNCERPCNGIFPIPSVSIRVEDYRSALFKFYEDFSRRDSPITFICSDLHNQLVRFASGKSSSNALGFLPFLIAAGHILLDFRVSGKESGRTVLERCIEQIFEGQDRHENIMSLSILLLSLEEWEFSRMTLLKTVVRRLHLPTELSDEELFEGTKAILYEYVLTDQIQKLTKKPSGQSVTIVEGKWKVCGHSDSVFVSEFLSRVCEDGMSTSSHFVELGERFVNEVFEKGNVDFVFEYVGDLVKVEEVGGSIAWIRSANESEK